MPLGTPPFTWNDLGWALQNHRTKWHSLPQKSYIISAAPSAPGGGDQNTGGSVAMPELRLGAPWSFKARTNLPIHASREIILMSACTASWATNWEICGTQPATNGHRSNLGPLRSWNIFLRGRISQKLIFLIMVAYNTKELVRFVLFAGSHSYCTNK